jgi:YaiO family outer membrane protein
MTALPRLPEPMPAMTPPSFPALRRLLLVLLLLVSRTVAGQGRTTIELNAGLDGLSGGYASWQEQGVELRHRASTRSGAGVSFQRLERFGLDDQRLAADVSLGLGRRITLGAEGEGSATHRVVARSGGAGRVHLSLGGGWGVEARAGLRQYDSVTVRAFGVSVERYWSAWLASYAFAPVRLSGSDATAASHLVRLTRFFGERGSLTLGGSAGREVESLGGGQVLAMDVRSLVAWGVLPLGTRLDATWAGGVVRQGELFTRLSGRLGLRVRAG